MDGRSKFKRSQESHSDGNVSLKVSADNCEGFSLMKRRLESDIGLGLTRAKTKYQRPLGLRLSVRPSVHPLICPPICL